MSVSQVFQVRLSESLRLALVYRLAHELNGDLSSADVLRRVLNATAEALGTPHASIVALKNGKLHAAYALGGGSADPRPVIEHVLANGLMGFVLHNYRTVIVNDITCNPLWLPLPNQPLSPQQGSALCVPLIHSGEVVGVMTLAHPITSYFTADAVNLTATVSEMGAAALANTLLLETTRQAEYRYTALFNDVIVPILITDDRGEILSANQRACEFLGYSAVELVGKSILTLHRMGAGPMGEDHFDHLKRGVEERFRSVIWTKDGSERLVEVYAKRLGGPHGDSIQWIEHDLTAQISMEQLRNDLSAMVYHDMRGPLGNVYTSIQALQTLLAQYPNPNVQTLLNLAKRSERQVRRMVDSLLDVQRLEAGNKLLSRANNNLDAIIQNAIEQIRPLADEKHIVLRLVLDDDLPQLYIDGEMVERVLVNLLDNAIKYSEEGSPVTISTAKSAQEVFVRVKDSGPGIPPEAQASIFDKFSRVKYRGVPHGMGLGLAFCKLAIDAHGGRIWVKSEPNEGSVFTFALPVEAPPTKELPRLGMAAQ